MCGSSSTAPSTCIVHFLSRQLSAPFTPPHCNFPRRKQANQWYMYRWLLEPDQGMVAKRSRTNRANVYTHYTKKLCKTQQGRITINPAILDFVHSKKQKSKMPTRGSEATRMETKIRRLLCHKEYGLYEGVGTRSKGWYHPEDILYPDVQLLQWI